MKLQKLLAGAVTAGLIAGFFAASPALADDEDRVACPCWTKAQGRRLVHEALEQSSDEWSCGSSINQGRTPLEEGEEGIIADFRVFEDGSELLDIVSFFSTQGDFGVQRCSVQVNGEDLVGVDLITRDEAAACTRILNKICLEQLHRASDDDDDDDD